MVKIRLKIERTGRAFAVELDVDTQPPTPDRWDASSSDTERAPAFDFDDRPPVRLGFQPNTTKETP